MRSLLVATPGHTSVRLRKEKAWVLKAGRPSQIAGRKPSTKKVRYNVIFNAKNGVLHNNNNKKDIRGHRRSVRGIYCRDSVLSEVIRCYRKVRRNTEMRCIMLLHDNIPANTSKFTKDYYLEKNTETLPHSSYLLDFAPCGLFFFPVSSLKKKKVCWLPFLHQGGKWIGGFPCPTQCPEERH